MKYSKEFWVVYDAAQERLNQDAEYIQLEADVRATMKSFADQEAVEKLMQSLQMQATMAAYEIWRGKTGQA
jgi:hypothetical protein